MRVLNRSQITDQNLIIIFNTGLKKFNNFFIRILKF